jgi:hypothetical protein
MRRELAFSCYGAQLLVVDAAGAGVCAELESVLPPSIVPSDGSAPDACFVIDRPEPRREGRESPYRILRHGEVLMRACSTERVVKRLRQEIDEAVAVFSRRGLFVHAGVVGWRGHAIVVPGRSMTGKSHLVGELVRCGATYYSDEFAVLGDDGRVHPYARMPVTRPEPDGVGAPFLHSSDERTAGEPLPISLVVATLYRRHAAWKPAELRGARAVLPIIDNTVLAQSETARLLHLCRLIAPTLVTLHGPRPDAASVAPRILAFLDAIIDARTSSGGETPSVATAPPPVAAASVPRVDGARSVDTVARSAEATALGKPFILLLHWNGRFGNRMHQYAYGATYARVNRCRFLLPSDWEGTHLFGTQHHSSLPHAGLCAELAAPHDPTEHRLELARRVVPGLKLISPNRRRQNYRDGGPVCFDDVCAFHPSIFAPMSRRHLLSVFEFSDAVKSLDLYRRLEDRQGSYDIAHLRRDDISNPNYNRSNPQGYSVISRESYVRAFAQYGFDPERIEWVSDDYRRQWHTDRPAAPRGRWRYPVGSEVLPHLLFDWLEDFLRLYFARTIFRANSSFSWWAAFLAPHARVFSPIIDSQHIYGVDGMEEVSVDFVEGNHPHWMFDNADIVIGA